MSKETYLIELEEHTRAASFVIILVGGGTRIEVIDWHITNLLFTQLILPITG